MSSEALLTELIISAGNLLSEARDLTGLLPSRRERIATAALQGLLACPGDNTISDLTRIYAAAACKYADALIDQLDAKADGGK